MSKSRKNSKRCKSFSNKKKDMIKEIKCHINYLRKKTKRRGQDKDFENKPVSFLKKVLDSYRKVKLDKSFKKSKKSKSKRTKRTKRTKRN